VVVEEYLNGREVSLLAFTDGTNVVPMVPACDYKRIADNDAGPNTGGMGCYSPPAFFSEDMVRRTVDEVIRPVVRAMASNGCEYRGVLYAGLMVDGDRIRVLEFNARFGDPETQVILPRLEGDLAEILTACAEGTLDRVKIGWKAGPCVGVVMASGGYPGSYAKGLPIAGLDRVDQDVLVLHAGTTVSPDGHVVTDGGRVLALVAAADTMAEARERVYNNVIRVSFPNMVFRTDIALREVA
jgi:phosphoribosylamine--glycine ligase